MKTKYVLKRFVFLISSYLKFKTIELKQKVLQCMNFLYEFS